MEEKPKKNTIDNIDDINEIPEFDTSMFDLEEPSKLDEIESTLDTLSKNHRITDKIVRKMKEDIAQIHYLVYIMSKQMDILISDKYPSAKKKLKLKKCKKLMRDRSNQSES